MIRESEREGKKTKILLKNRETYIDTNTHINICITKYGIRTQNNSSLYYLFVLQVRKWAHIISYRAEI